MKIVALNNQTLLDIAIQEYGTVEAVFELALANDISVHAEMQVGMKYDIPNSTKNIEILNYYQKQQIKPSTDITKQNEADLIQLDGIGYMAIGSTFIIQ